MRKKIETDDKTPSLNIDEIEETGSFYYKDEPNVLYVKAIPKRAYSGPCTACGAFSVKGHGKGTTRYVHDISIGETSIDIVLTTPRYICASCGKSFTHHFEFVKDRSKFTDRLEANIIRQALRYPFSDVAKEYGVTISTISKMVVRYAKYYDDHRHVVAPRVLGIDENHLNRMYCGILTDIEKGTLIDITPSRKNKDLDKVIRKMDGWVNNVEIVTTDMFGAYRDLIRHTFPDAVHVIDRFHVVKMLSSGKDTARKVITEYLKERLSKIKDPEERKRKEELLANLGNCNRLFLFNDESLKKKEMRVQLLGELVKTFPEFEKLYDVRCRCEKIYQSKTREEAEEVIIGIKRCIYLTNKIEDEAIKYVTEEDIEKEVEKQVEKAIQKADEEGATESEKEKAIEKARETAKKKVIQDAREAAKRMDKEAYKEIMKFFNNTYNNWKIEILNYFDYPYTNAATEGLNNLIMMFHRAGKSYRFEAMRIKALYASQTALKKPVAARKKPKDDVACYNEDYEFIVPISKDDSEQYMGTDINMLVKEFDNIF